jgi:hypothetical protein
LHHIFFKFQPADITAPMPIPLATVKTENYLSHYLSSSARTSIPLSVSLIVT